MPTHTHIPCEFSLIRYVPDVVKGEFVNIGILLREAGAGAGADSIIQLKFTRDWSRVRCMDAGADTGLLEDLEQEFTARLAQGTSTREPRGLLEVLEDSLSNSIQMTRPRATLAESLVAQMDQLMRLYVEPIPTERGPEKSRTRKARPTLQAAMRTHFERAGVWPLLTKRMPAERYTRKGDPLRLDCGYRYQPAKLAPVIRIFQAVSLEGDLEMARVLAFTAEPLRQGIARIEGATLDLTAIVEPLRTLTDTEGETQDRYRFGVETMEQQAIRVVTLNDLARIATTARNELGL